MSHFAGVSPAVPSTGPPGVTTGPPSASIPGTTLPPAVGSTMSAKPPVPSTPAGLSLITGINLVDLLQT